jgi:hypothetical protein
LHVLLAGLLVLDGLGTALRVAARLPTLGVYDPLARALILIRAMAGALALTSGWWLLGRRPAAPAMAGSALVLSAILTTLESGFLLAPASVPFDSWRWPYVVVSWIYAMAWMAWLRGRRHRHPRTKVHSWRHNGRCR